jgi:hypothetical protein
VRCVDLFIEFIQTLRKTVINSLCKTSTKCGTFLFSSLIIVTLIIENKETTNNINYDRYDLKDTSQFTD